METPETDDPPLSLPTEPVLKRRKDRPVMIEDRVALSAREHEERRVASFEAGPLWLGKALQPFSLARRNLFWRLRELDGPVLEWRVEIAKEGLFLSSAVKLLWLMHQDEESTRNLRAVMRDEARVSLVLEVIDDWAAKEVSPLHDSEACKFAIDVLTAIADQSAVPEPVPGGRSGNERGPSSPRSSRRNSRGPAPACSRKKTSTTASGSRRSKS